MLVGFNSAKEPPGNGEDALDVIHRAFDPCDESPGFDMDDFYDYGSVARSYRTATTRIHGSGVAQDVLQHGHYPGAPPAPAHGDRPRPSLCLRRFMTRFFKYVKKLHVDHAIFVETFEDPGGSHPPVPVHADHSRREAGGNPRYSARGLHRFYLGDDGNVCARRRARPVLLGHAAWASRDI